MLSPCGIEANIVVCGCGSEDQEGQVPRTHPRKRRKGRAASAYNRRDSPPSAGTIYRSNRSRCEHTRPEPRRRMLRESRSAKPAVSRGQERLPRETTRHEGVEEARIQSMTPLDRASLATLFAEGTNPPIIPRWRIEAHIRHPWLLGL